MGNNRFKLENMLIRSHAHLRSLKLKAYFKATKDLYFDGLPNKYVNFSMTRMQGSRYLINAYNYATGNHESYSIDVDTLTAKRLEMVITYFNSCLIEGDYTLLVRNFNPMAIFRDLREIGQIEFEAKHELCKNGQSIRGRYTQQAGHSVYAVDRLARLYRIEWQDIKDGKYVKTLLKTNVKNFFVDEKLGMVTLNLDRTLSLPNLSEVDLKAKVNSEAKWTIATCIAKCWIVSGDLDVGRDGQAIMASISRQGYIRSILKLKLTSNGYVSEDDGIMFAGIYSLHQAYDRGRRGIILAIEKIGRAHV